MPVRRSSTRPTLARILARCHFKSREMAMIIAKQKRGKGEYMQVPVS
jgi:hypothetical protein